MDDDGPTASIIFFVVLLLIDVFFYGFGAALSSLNEKEIERRAEEEKDRKSIRLKTILGSPAEYDNTVQLITTLINVIIGAVHLGLLLQNLSKGLQLVAENFYMSAFVHNAYHRCAAAEENCGKGSGKVGICLYYACIFCDEAVWAFYRACDCDYQWYIENLRQQWKDRRD